MRYYKEEEAESIDDFEWWSGAKDRIDEVRSLPEAAQKEFWEFVEEYFATFNKVPSATELNDFVWFECDDFIEELKETYNEPEGEIDPGNDWEYDN
jgi:hypothetical protein